MEDEETVQIITATVEGESPWVRHNRMLDKAAWHLGEVVRLELLLLQRKATISQAQAHQVEKLVNEISEFRLLQEENQIEANKLIAQSMCVQALDLWKGAKGFVELCMNQYEAGGWYDPSDAQEVLDKTIEGFQL